MNIERKELLSDMLASMTDCSLDYASKVIEIVSDIPLTLSKLMDKINQLEADKLEMAKAIYEISNTVGVSAKYLDLMDKVEKYIKEVEK